jgi:hypothetical protein
LSQQFVARLRRGEQFAELELAFRADAKRRAGKEPQDAVARRIAIERRS